eukprot:SAG22_NODE_6098_length_898_cov_4.131414_1_plen_169_part_01
MAAVAAAPSQQQQPPPPPRYRPVGFEALAHLQQSVYSGPRLEARFDGRWYPVVVKHLSADGAAARLYYPTTDEEEWLERKDVGARKDWLRIAADAWTGDFVAACWSTAELKERLRELGLPVSGPKRQLCERLVAQLSRAEAAQFWQARQHVGGSGGGGGGGGDEPPAPL